MSINKIKYSSTFKDFWKNFSTEEFLNLLKLLLENSKSVSKLYRENMPNVNLTKI